MPHRPRVHGGPRSWASLALGAMIGSLWFALLLLRIISAMTALAILFLCLIGAVCVSWWLQKPSR